MQDRDNNAIQVQTVLARLFYQEIGSTCYWTDAICDLQYDELFGKPPCNAPINSTHKECNWGYKNFLRRIPTKENVCFCGNKNLPTGTSWLPIAMTNEIEGMKCKKDLQNEKKWYEPHCTPRIIQSSEDLPIRGVEEFEFQVRIRERNKALQT